MKSPIEGQFAAELEKNDAVKLLGRFSVPTPLGAYHSDWAVLIELNDAERLYFVVETKGTLFTDALRNTEAGKIRCCEEHFKSIARGDNPARFKKSSRPIWNRMPMAIGRSGAQAVLLKQCMDCSAAATRATKLDDLLADMD